MEPNKNFLLSRKEKADIKQEQYEKIRRLQENYPEIPFPENKIPTGRSLIEATIEDEMLWASISCKQNIKEYDIALEHIRKATELIMTLKKF